LSDVGPWIAGSRGYAKTQQRCRFVLSFRQERTLPSAGRPRHPAGSEFRVRKTSPAWSGNGSRSLDELFTQGKGVSD